MPFFDHFNLIAPLYDRVIKPSDPEMMRKLAGLPVEGKLLDVGGGTGRSSQSLRGAARWIVIADSSTGMLEQARKKDGLIPVRTHAEDLSFASESFERVIMVDALHHVYDHRLTLNEMWRILKPGGRIVIEEPDIRSWPAQVMTIVEKLVLMRSHLVSPIVVEHHFHQLGAGTRIERQGSTCWVIIDK